MLDFINHQRLSDSFHEALGILKGARSDQKIIKCQIVAV